MDGRLKRYLNGGTSHLAILRAGPVNQGANIGLILQRMAMYLGINFRTL